ncbi:MAG: hypothetical protein L6308_03515 [Candidatus Omnitrophica bacterium]|nr:hypothetical protein [Candidatus Omnitrophota bacterium]
MKRKFPKILYFLVCFLLIFEQSGFAQVAGQLDISRYFSGLSSSLSLDKFRPLHLRYLSYDNLNNSFNLLLDKGDSKDLKETNLKDSTKELMNYFFTGIALPNDSFWVNLRPDSPDNIIDPYLAQTDLGKIFLEADLQLKKDTASFTSPQTREGKQYWDKLYKKAGELFGSENITIPTLTRPWIVPGEIIIRESTDNAYIYKATLKVMLEQDYLKGSAVYNFQDERLKQLNEYSSQLIRATIIPKLTKDVNTAKRYAPLRQAYYSLILAQWFKQKFYGKGGFYSSLINRNNLTGLTSKEAWSKTTYFQAYQKSFKEGEYNIKEQVYALGSPTIRSYMSGGIAWQDISKVSFPIVGTEKRNPFNSKLGKFIIAAFVAGAIIFPSSNNAAGTASFDTAANTAQISAPAASANLELQRVPIPIVAKNAPATGVSGLGEIGTDLASVRTILNDLAAAGIKHIEPRLLLKYINIANDVNTRDKIGKAYNLLRTKGVYSGPMYRVLFVQDLNNQVIVLAKSGVVVLDLFLLSEQSQIKELPVLLSAGASFLSDKSPLLERHLNAQKKKMAAMTVLGIPPRYQTGINKAFEAIYTRAGSLAKELAIDNKEQFLNNTIIMNIAVKEMDLTRLKQNNRLRVILKIWHPFARKYFEYPVFIHPNGSVEGGKIEERKEDLSPAGWVPVLSESKENIIYSLPVALPASSSPVIYRGVEDMVENLPGKIGANSTPIRDLIEWLQKVYGLHKGLLYDFYHNQAHNLGTADIFSYFLKNRGNLEDQDIRIAILAALMHDFHSRISEGDKGIPAYVPETLLQLRDLMGIEDYSGPAKEKILSSYKEKISEDLKNEFRQILSKLFPAEKIEDLYNEIKAMIMRTDYASDVASPKEYYKNAAAEIRQRMDIYLNELEEWVSLDGAVGLINLGYKTLEEKATLEQDEVASIWLARQKGIELGYLTALNNIKKPGRRELIHTISLLLEIADQTSFYDLLTGEAIEKYIISGLKKEGVVASPEGSYKFFFEPQFLNKPEVLAALKTLPMEYRENFVNTMEYFALRGNALKDWDNRKKEVEKALGLDEGVLGAVKRVEEARNTIMLTGLKEQPNAYYSNEASSNLKTFLKALGVPEGSVILNIGYGANPLSGRDEKGVTIYRVINVDTQAPFGIKEGDFEIREKEFFEIKPDSLKELGLQKKPDVILFYNMRTYMDIYGPYKVYSQFLEVDPLLNVVEYFKKAAELVAPTGYILFVNFMPPEGERPRIIPDIMERLKDRKATIFKTGDSDYSKVAVAFSPEVNSSAIETKSVSSPVETIFSGKEIAGDLLYLENVARETLSMPEEGFKEKAFLLFGTKLGEKYDIKRIIPVLKYLKQTQDYVESDPVHIAELIDKYAAGETKLLGALHTHPYDVTKIITKPGPSWQDRLGEDFLLPERSEKIIDIPLGVVIEAAVPKDISLEGLQDVVPDINAYFYLPEEKAGIKTIDVFKVINFKEWIDQKGNNLVVVSSAIKRPRVEPKEDIGFVSMNNGEKLFMRKGQDENIVSIAFYNQNGEQVGFTDILLRESLLNYIYINPNFRSNNYFKVILDAILDKLQDQSFTGRQFTFVTAYAQNPLIVNYLLGKGFILNPYPMPTEQSLMTKATLSKSRQIEGKISLFIEDETKRDAFKNTLGNEGFEIVDKPIEGETYTVMINAKYTLYFEEKSGETQANSASPVYNEEQKKGGIDFRTLPIASQPLLINQKVNASIIPPIPLAELNSEWLRIENMLASGITPSSERIKEYLQSCSQKQDFNQDIDKVLSCIADIFRFEEERVADTDASLKAMLMLLESDKPVAQMQLALAQITVEAKEPKIIE